MKKILFILILGVIGLSLVSPNNSSKIGFVNLDDILETMPEMMEIDQKVNNFAKTKNSALAEIIVKYGEEYQKFESHKEEWNEKMKFKKQTELGEMADEIQELSDNNKKQIALKRKILCEPLLFKIKNEIKTISENKGFTAVFDSKNESLLYSSEANDITNMVRDAIIK